MFLWKEALPALTYYSSGHRWSSRGEIAKPFITSLSPVLQFFGSLCKICHNTSLLPACFIHSLCDVNFWLFSSRRNEVSFSSPWIWTGLMTCFTIYPLLELGRSESVSVLRLDLRRHSCLCTLWGPPQSPSWANLLEDDRPQGAEMSNSNVPTKAPDMLGFLAKITKIADMSQAVPWMYEEVTQLSSA